MGYPSPLTGVARAVTDSIFTFSTPFLRVNKFHFGGRLTLIRTTDSTFTIYSTVPHAPAVVDSLNKLLRERGILTESESFESKVTSIVIPDREHTMAVPAWKEALSKLNVTPTIIGPEGCLKDHATCSVDVTFPSSVAYKSLSGEDLVQFGLNASDPLVSTGNFKFMYFPGHANLEIVLLDEKNATLMEGDMFFNFQLDNKKNPNSDVFNEQFDYKTPHSGIWGWLTKKVFTEESFLGKFALNSIYTDKPNCRKGVDIMLETWKFDKIIPCHGDVIDHNGVAVWKEAFAFLP